MKPLWFAVLFCGCFVTHVAAQTTDHPWYVGIGVTLTPRVAEVASDYRPATQFTSSNLVFPQFFVGYRISHLAVEAGYRKLGTLRFATADGASKGNTHSNALTFGVLVPFAQRRHKRVELYGKLAVNPVRTITQFEQRVTSFPIQGGQNVWRVRPSLGLGAAFKMQSRWSLRTEGEVLLGQLGNATQSGRYQQTLIGLSLARHF